MTRLANLPRKVRILGWGKSRLIRELWQERCNAAEIALYLNTTRSIVSQALRWKAGDYPLAIRSNGKWHLITKPYG